MKTQVNGFEGVVGFAGDLLDRIAGKGLFVF